MKRSDNQIGDVGESSSRLTSPVDQFSRGDEASALCSFHPLGPAIKALMIWPEIPPSFWGSQGMGIVPENAGMPPLGLITVAALCPKNWTVRLIDRAVDKLEDADFLWADLVMVGGMHVQKKDVKNLLARARELGRRTIVGGPYASSEPDKLLALADHVVVGEPDEVFDKIAGELEHGLARRLYVISDKPDVSRTPPPRFDLLKLENYRFMSVQFSRGCPFQCEFCDIITIYGRKPRTKAPAQLLAELQLLVDLGWRKHVFVVDDNFIGNHKLALELCVEMESWQKTRNYPLVFFTEASIDLAQRTELMDAMVRANFLFVFIGIESPSKESLKEAKKFQNLRHDPLESVHIIQARGLWVTAGFIMGFDSDTGEIFELQREFIERAAIPWAMAGFLQAPPTTPLFDRMLKAGRLNLDTQATSNFDVPNFKTILPLPVLLSGFRDTLVSLYSPAAFYNRSYRSLQKWHVGAAQRAVQYPAQYKERSGMIRIIRIIARSMYHQGLRSNYRLAYWTFLIRVFGRWMFNRPKLSLGLVLLISGHHFIGYARNVVGQLDLELGRLPTERPAIAPAPQPAVPAC
jgi:radical SAM superfamily enzyme YgiQ (UPF0313 family)